MKFLPIVYEHAAKFVGKSPREVSRSGELLLQAHAEAFRFYRHSPVVMGIDIYNLEAEAYGAEIDEPLYNQVPSISAPICELADSILGLTAPDPARDGRLPMVIDAGIRFSEQFSDTQVLIPVTGPFSLAGQLVGLEQLLVEALERPESLAKVLDFLLVGQLRYCAEIHRQGVGTILFESTAAPPLLSPSLFRNVVLPPLKALVGEVSRKYNHDMPCIIGGDTAVILDSLLETGSKYVICPAETDQQRFLDRVGPNSDVEVRINMNPGVFSSNDTAVARSDADRVLSLARGIERVSIGTGILDYDANPDMVMEIGTHVRLHEY